MSKVSITNLNGCLSLNGFIDLHNLAVLRLQGEEIINQLAEKKIKLDLTHTKSESSISLSLLLCWIRYAAKQNKTIRIINLPQPLKDLCTLYNLSKILYDG